jgi:hypothetical protein
MSFDGAATASAAGAAGEAGVDCAALVEAIANHGTVKINGRKRARNVASQ